MPKSDLPNPARNLSGYGKYPPDPKWPENARIVLNFVINIEEGSERCILNGDPNSENYLAEIANRKRINETIYPNRSSNMEPDAVFGD